MQHKLWGQADCGSLCSVTFGGLFWVATLCYGAALGMLCYNSYWYIYRQNRYRSHYVMSFYIFSMIIIVSRFLCYLLLLVYYYESPSDPDTAILAQNIQGISIYADICLGMFQVAAMRVLTLQLRGE